MKAAKGIKGLVKRALTELVAELPVGGRQAIFERLSSQFGIVGVQGAGEYGKVLSAVGDFSVFDTYARTGSWARHTNTTIQEFFAGRTGTYLDIGANIGLTTIPIARNPQVKCLAFEPDPTNFENLRQNVALNCSFGNVELHNLALFTHQATLQFELAERNLGDHRLRINDAVPGQFGEEKRRTIAVSTLPLNEFKDSVHGALAVKIDTQGAEPFVIEGGSDVLSSAGLLIMEFAPYHMRRLGGDANKVIDFIEENFVSASIAVGEMAFGESMATGPLCAKLRAIWDSSRHANAEAQYFDLCLRKQPHSSQDQVEINSKRSP